MGEEYEVFIKSSVRGYHAYFVDASVTIGEVLACEREDNNIFFLLFFLLFFILFLFYFFYLFIYFLFKTFITIITKNYLKRK